MSNNGSLTAYPVGGESRVEPAEGRILDGLFRRLHAGQTIDLPSGAGFCLYIKRACLDAVGDFDEAAFGRGQGEDNDFCLRAAALGWRHVGAMDTFVRHAGGGSFGSLATILREHNLKTVYRRYPPYRSSIRFPRADDPATPFRRAVDEARRKAEHPGPDGEGRPQDSE
jgi:GT2 family glycosyltransferase